MIKARTTIIAGGKVFRAGQTVNGLSRLDRKWMSDAGYITETAGKKEAEGLPVPEEKTGDEQL